MIVCADDVGMAEDIDRAALELAALGRVSAVSCMVVGAPPPFEALQSCPKGLDIGLHLTLTECSPVAARDRVRTLLGRDGRMVSFGCLLRRSAAGAVDPADARREIAAQYARFTAWAGRPPDFLDSHLHVHQFPGIRAGLLRLVEDLAGTRKPYVRNAHLPFARVLAQGVSVAKCLAIGFPGGRLRRALRARGIPTNDGFAGIYDYRRYAAFPRFLERFAATVTNPDGIVMTHPGKAEPWRRAEYEGLKAAEFLAGRVTRFPAH